jgi:hypothetical protein
VIGTGGFLLSKFIEFSHRNALPAFLAKWFAPILIWFLFGVGALINLFWSRIGYPVYDIHLSITSVLLASGSMFLGVIFYIFGFDIFFSGNVYTKKDLSKYRVIILLVLIIAFDWVVRILKIDQGIYFSWSAQASVFRRELRVNPFYQFQEFITYLIFPLSLFLYKRTEKKWVFLGVSIIQLSLIFIEGDRSSLLYAIAILLISYLSVFQIQVEIKHLIFLGVVFVLFIFVVSPVIQEARIIMKKDISGISGEPVITFKDFLFEYIPLGIPNINYSKYFALEERSSITHRLGSYMGYLTSIQQAMREGVQNQNLQSLSQALLTIIPRIIYPGKPTIDADARVFSHFGIGREGLDAAGTYVADIFSFLGFRGVILILFTGGVLTAVIYNLLVFNFDTLGELLLIGFLPQFVLIGDNFAVYFVNFRNILLLVFILTLYFKIKVSAVNDADL